ncbi:MAG: permease prefix domain 2-containing transporter [Bacteroidota bacterium]
MNLPDSHPPRWLDRFLEWFCDEDLLEEIQGDLHEAYHDRAQHFGRARANRLFAADVFRFFKPYAFEKYSRAKQFLPMFDNYFKVALRNILHRKAFTAINLIGLTFGVSAVLLIGLFVKYELTYDMAVPDHDRIHRVMNHYRDQVYTPMYFQDYYQSGRDAQLRLINHLTRYEEVETACHFVPSESAIGGRDQYYVEFDGKQVVAKNVLYTNTGLAFQAVFPQRFLLGTPEGAFAGFDKIILTESAAKDWFGSRWRNQDILGKTVTIREEMLEITGVIADVPDNVHYTFDWIVHQQLIPSWGAYTYLKLRPEAEIEPVIARLNQEVDLVYPGYSEDVLRKELLSVALTDIHFTGDTLYELKPIANKAYLSIFGIVGWVLLLIVWTNYTNLSIAMYADRQKELGMRKVLGALPSDISFQLLVEAVLLALICFPFCWGIVYLYTPYFGELMGIELSGSQGLTLGASLVLFGILFLTGLFSGLYPAITYGRRSMLHLFGEGRKKILAISRHLNFRNALVVVQFTMVIGLLSITSFIYLQMEYIQTKDLGFQKEGVVYFGVDGGEKYARLKAVLAGFPEVQAIGANGVPGSDMYNQMTYKMKDTDVTLSDGTQLYVERGTFEALGIACEPCRQMDEGKAQMFLINRTAAEKLAKIKGVEPEALIGETLISEPEWENEEFGYGIPETIDGIIDDFKYFSLKYPNQTLLINAYAETEWAETMILRLQTDNWPETMEKVKSAYKSVETVRPFDVTFLEARLDQLYQTERRSGILMAVLSVIAIILALMGLAGIVSYVAFSRQKEISIRKILGASVSHIMMSFQREFLLLLGIAALIATPLSMSLFSWWLESFAYHIEPNPLIVGLAGLVAALPVIGLILIWVRRVANKEPVEVLRSE